MSEETPNPIMPKRPVGRPPKARPEGKRKPAKTLPLRQQDEENIEEVEHKAELLTLDQLGCILMAIQWSPEAAAERLGWTLKKVDETLRLPQSRYISKKTTDKIIDKIANAQVNAMKKVGISRGVIEARLMELAMMDPSDTKGDIAGQVKAATALAEKFGYAKKEDPLEGKSKEELEGIVRKGGLLLVG
jgi:hypothetical protein